MPGEQRKYGTTIAPSLYAPVHQHFFVARMDMAVDCKPNEAHNQVGVPPAVSCRICFSCCNQNFHFKILQSHLSTSSITLGHAFLACLLIFASIHFI